MDDPLTRRTVLSGASLAGLALSASDDPAANTGARARPLPPPNDAATTGVISVRQFGAIGDGQFHPLSSRFSTLGAAQVDYPDAGALSDSLDGAAIQAAIAHAARLGEKLQSRWCVHIPAGRYRLSRSIRLPSNVSLTGDGLGASIIDNQNTRLDAPLVVNADPEAASMSLRDLSLHGGTHGVRINVKQYVDGYAFLRVGFQMQSDKNFECNRLLQIGTFDGCVFAKAPYGVFVAEWTTNVANFFNCSFEDHARASVHLNAAEAVNFFGGRFESGSGSKGDAATIELTRAAAINFKGVYFEGTHPILLRERQSRHGVSFVGCHFTASSDGPYQFDSDGIVHFGPNDWGSFSSGPARMALSGANPGLVGPGRRYVLRAPTDWTIRSEQVQLGPGDTHTLAVLTRVGEGSGAASISGTLNLTRMVSHANGTLTSTTSYRISATQSGSSPIAVNLAPLTEAASPLRVAPGPAGRDRITLVASAIDRVEGIIRWTIEAQAISAGLDNRMEIDID